MLFCKRLLVCWHVYVSVEHACSNIFFKDAWSRSIQSSQMFVWRPEDFEGIDHLRTLTVIMYEGQMCCDDWQNPLVMPNIMKEVVLCNLKKRTWIDQSQQIKPIQFNLFQNKRNGHSVIFCFDSPLKFYTWIVVLTHSCFCRRRRCSIASGSIDHGPLLPCALPRSSLSSSGCCSLFVCMLTIVGTASPPWRFKSSSFICHATAQAHSKIVLSRRFLLHPSLASLSVAS